MTLLPTDGNGNRIAIPILKWTVGIIAAIISAFTTWAIGWSVLTVMHDHYTIGVLDTREQGHYEALNAGQANRYTSLDAAKEKAAIYREIDRLDSRVGKLEDNGGDRRPR